MPDKIPDVDTIATIAIDRGYDAKIIDGTSVIISFLSFIEPGTGNILPNAVRRRLKINLERDKNNAWIIYDLDDNNRIVDLYWYKLNFKSFLDNIKTVEYWNMRYNK